MPTEPDSCSRKTNEDGGSTPPSLGCLSPKKKKKPKCLKGPCVSKLDAFSANAVASSFKEGWAEKSAFCWLLSGVGVRRGGSRGRR